MSDTIFSSFLCIRPYWRHSSPLKNTRKLQKQEGIQYIFIRTISMLVFTEFTTKKKKLLFTYILTPENPICQFEEDLFSTKGRF